MASLQFCKPVFLAISKAPIETVYEAFACLEKDWPAEHRRDARGVVLDTYRVACEACGRAMSSQHERSIQRAYEAFAAAAEAAAIISPETRPGHSLRE